MKSKGAIVIVLLVLSVMLGCLSTTPAPPTSPPGDEVILGEAVVEDIDILILESFPVQVNVVVRGNLPDGCTRIDRVIKERDGNTFTVTITTVRPADAVCTEALVPFEELISLDVYGLPAGVYIVDVNGVSDTFELTVDNVPPEETTLGGIGGKVWHDLCAVPHETVDEPPDGCVRTESGGLQANGVLEPDEPGIGGVEVALGAGACPATGLATTVSDSDGVYAFVGLEAGTYCVSIDALVAPNEGILIPGGWTSPDQGQATIALGAGETLSDVNFGWDYQFLP